MQDLDGDVGFESARVRAIDSGLTAASNDLFELVLAAAQRRPDQIVIHVAGGRAYVRRVTSGLPGGYRAKLCLRAGGHGSHQSDVSRVNWGAPKRTECCPRGTPA